MSEKVTNCEKCGKELKYKTKKPRWCSKCSPFKFYKQPSEGVTAKPPKRSSLEFQVQNWVEEIYPDRPFIINGYYSWLKSPKGYPMQIDLLIYGPKPWIAVEIEGIQHQEKQFFQTQEEFDYLRECDQQKEWILKNKGIKLVKVYNKDCANIDDLEKMLRAVE